MGASQLMVFLVSQLHVLGVHYPQLTHPRLKRNEPGLLPALGCCQEGPHKLSWWEF